MSKRKTPLAPKAPKVPTEQHKRSHSWKSRVRYESHKEVNEKGAESIVTIPIREWRPTTLGRTRYGIKDLGWQQAEKYLTARGALTKAAQG